MNAIRELLERPDWQDRQQRIGAPTGLGDLDDVTGGLVPGVVWIITGASGVGLSVLARGFAAGAALAGRKTTLICGRDRAEEAVAAMVCANARVLALSLTKGSLDGADQARVTRAVQALGATSLQIVGSPVPWGVPRLSAAAVACGDPEEPFYFALLLGHAGDRYAEVVVIDDFDALTQGSDVLRILDLLRHTAHFAPLVLVVTLPKAEVMAGGRPSDRAARVADVILHLERDDQDDRHDPRAGEIDMCVVRNRYGPTVMITAAFQGHYRRIVSLTRQEERQR